MEHTAGLAGEVTAAETEEESSVSDAAVTATISLDIATPPSKKLLGQTRKKKARSII